VTFGVLQVSLIRSEMSYPFFVLATASWLARMHSSRLHLGALPKRADKKLTKATRLFRLLCYCLFVIQTKTTYP
jgi:hypothetical protein